MKIISAKQRLLYPLLTLLMITLNSAAQVKSAYTMNAAYTTLNAGSSGGSTYVGNSSTGIKAVTTIPSVGYVGPLSKKWYIKFGIPTQVAFDFVTIRSKMVIAYDDDMELYNNGTPAFKQAVDFLGWTEFSTISSWAPVKCTIKFRFISPVLGKTDFLKFDASIDPSDAPERGSATFWIR